MLGLNRVQVQWESDRRRNKATDDTARPSMAVVSPEGINAALAKPAYVPKVGDEVEYTFRARVSHVWPAGHGGDDMPPMVTIRKQPADSGLCVPVADVRPTSDEPGEVET